MLAAAEELRFEYAAKLRDEIRELRRELDRPRRLAGCDGSVPRVQRVSFRIPADAREDVLDGAAAAAAAGIVERSGEGVAELSSSARRCPRARRCAARRRAAAGRAGRRGGAGRLARAPAPLRRRRVRDRGRLMVRSP